MSRVVLRTASGLLAVLLLVGTKPAQADLISIDFGTSASVGALPYAEDGFTFSTLLGGSQVNGSAGDTNRYLNLLGASTPNARVRISGPGAFDLQSFDLRDVSSQPWTVSASSGASLVIPNATAVGTIDFTALAGWTNLTFVDISHTLMGNGANLRLDNFVFNTQAVPEPGSLALVAVSGGVLGLTRFVRRRRQAAATR
ncbi:MAG TPA: PEP-CTERM sorting domain-containing protein [Caulifigura sp.]|jgi:hypothetical protein|nr:PEP-CTERM sorting domain-containing protein [Caulifigura sp.]